MPNVNFDLHHRLEPQRAHRDDLQRGFMAEIADPLWFLGRQWQLGEHQGENAASPVLVQARYARRTIGSDPTRPGQLPGSAAGEPITPAEAIVEGEPDDWWTYGRRIRVGLAAAAAVDALPLGARARRALRFAALPEAYAAFVGGYDGRELYRRRAQLGLAAELFPDVPGTPRGDHWNAAEFVYDTRFPLDERTLDVPRHDGGEVDWWSVDADGALPDAADAVTRELQPARFSYPGAPLPRWWQIEDAQVDIGGLPPDRSHFATMLLVDLIVSHGNDWFLFPLPAAIGEVVTIEALAVYDTFGTSWSSTDDARLRPPEDWSLFQIAGLNPGALALWPTAVTPLEGDALEQIALGVDEDANLMWAVEERSDGRWLTSPTITAPRPPELEPNVALQAAGKSYLYRPSSFVPHHWHPYVIDDGVPVRRFVQGRLADYTSYESTRRTWLAPEPTARLLADERRAPGEPVHAVSPSAVPVMGLRLDRRFALARRTDGAAVLWVQRRRLPLLSPPASGLRFDVLEER